MGLTGQRRRDYLKRQRDERRGQLMQMLGGRCVICGQKNNLEFHHRPGTEKRNAVSRMLNGHTFEAVVVEAKKCELRCRRHHADAHHDDVPHGTCRRWWRGCRCNACVTAHRPYARQQMRKWRAKNTNR